ncbi:DNA topoisomerase 2 [Tanacetum coccineum]
MGKSTETLQLLTNEQKAFRDNLRKSGLGYNGPYVLSHANAKVSKLYSAYELRNENEQLHVFDSEDTLEDAEKSRLKMNEFQKDEKVQELKIKPINYGKLNKLYDDFVPQKELSAEQKYFSSSFISSDKTSNATSYIPTSMPKSELCGLKKQNELLKDRLLEASLAEDSKDVSNKSKTVDTFCNDACDVTQELSKRIVELEKDLSKVEANSIAFEIALQHKSRENNSLKTLKKNENFLTSLQIKNAHLKQTYKNLFEPVQRSKVETNQCDEVKVNVNFDEIETKNIELEHQVASLLKENEHLKIAKFEAYFEKLEKTKVIFERQLARKVDDSKAKNDQFLKEINHLRTQLENLKGKSVKTKFDKPSILGKPPADKLLTNSQISRSWFTPKVDMQKIWNNGDSTKKITAADEHDRLYKQVFLSELETVPDINTCTSSSKNWTMVSFKHDLSKFGMKCLEDTVALMKRRVVDIAGCLKGVKVELDGTHVQLETFQDYAKLYLGTSTSNYLSIYEHVNDGLEICVVIADGNCEQVSFVNNVATKVGSHVDYITGQITSYLGKILNLEPNYIKSHLWVFVNAAFDENLMKGSFRSTCKLTPHFLKKIANVHVMNRLLSHADLKENQKLKKTDGKGEWKLNIPNLEDAYFAATTYSEDCTLILTQGNSAKAFAMCGLSVVGQDYYGIFPLKGKLLNVREASNEKLQKNTEIQNIKKILGLEDHKIYKNVKELRYGHLMIMADQDHNGSRFKALLINFLHLFWPSLLKVPNFMLDFIPPIVKASTKETTLKNLAFYSMAEYEAWKKNLENKATEYEIKYCKGLASSETEEVEEYFADLDNYTKEFVWVDDEDGDAIEIAFDKMKIGERKYWLRAHQAGDSKEKHIRYRDYINKELFVFSNQISIPSIVDGLNLGKRKILFCAFMKPIIEEIQVSKFSGYVSVHSAYHHDNASLVDTIIDMAQNYVGSNNINLLQPNGNFGTRLMGGKDHSSARYIFTQLSPITRYIFQKTDEHLLNYLNDNGQSIEPAWFIPIIPMVLVNGGEGIGTGWSSFIPKYNPRDIIANLIRLLNGEAMVPMIPWYKCFKGSIQKEKSGYTTRGIIEEIEGKNALKITELPVRMCTRKYEEILQAAREDGKDKTPFIKAYTACNDAENVHFEITMTEDQMNTAKKEGLWKKFKLTTTLSTANMYLFDEYGHGLTRQLSFGNNEISIKHATEKPRETRDVDAEGQRARKCQQNGFSRTWISILAVYITHGSFTREKIKELQEERNDKQKEFDALNIANPESLWLRELVALDEQLRIDVRNETYETFIFANNFLQCNTK